MYRKVTNSTKLYIHYYYKQKGFTRSVSNVGKQVKYKDIIDLFKSKKIDGVGVHIDEVGDVEPLNYEQFVTVYLSLDVFFDNVVNEVINYVAYKTGYVVSRDEVTFNMASGLYERGNYYSSRAEVNIRMSLVRDAYITPINRNLIRKVRKVLYHEIGHHIHYKYFGDKDIGLPDCGRNWENCQEDFAYTFDSLMLSFEEGKSLNKRESYLYEVLRSKRK